MMKARRRISLFDGINILILLLLTVIFIYPLYYSLIASFSDFNAVATGKLGLWPVGFQLTAYEAVLKNSQIWLGYRNTIYYTVFGTLFNLFLTIPTAFVMSRKHTIGHTVITWYFLITMYFSGGMIPTYILFRQLGLVNNPLVMIVSGGLSIHNMIVTRTYFANSIPESLYEAARIDGCTDFGLFFKIALPLSAPIIAVMCLYYAVGHWNGYFNAMIYLTKVEYQPLSLVLRRILITNETALEDALANGGGLSADIIEELTNRSNLAIVMKYALVLIVSAPMLMVYPFIQRYFVKGVMVGSVKG